MTAEFDVRSQLKALNAWNARTPSLDWIVNRAVGIARNNFWIDMDTNEQKFGWRPSEEQILEQIKKELEER